MPRLQNKYVFIIGLLIFTSIILNVDWRFTIFDFEIVKIRTGNAGDEDYKSIYAKSFKKGSQKEEKKVSEFGFNSDKKTSTSKPFSVYHYPIKLLLNHDKKCNSTSEQLDIVFLVKSFINNVNERNSIRLTWGQTNPFPDLKTRLVFLMGVNRTKEIVSKEILKENKIFNDIILGDFEDEYFNVTIKVFMGMLWARIYCPNSKFYIFADDDAYISVRKLSTYLKDQITYDDKKMFPNQFLKEKEEEMDVKFKASMKLRFFGGFVNCNSAPLRAVKLMINKTEDDKYPCFVKGHVMVMSRQILDDFSIAARFTKYISLDDIYLGSLAVRAGVVPFQIPGVFSSAIDVNKTNLFNNIIACHHMEPHDLIRIFTLQRRRGNA